MTWSWSHSSEAYENFRAQIHAQPREWLVEVFAEWKARGNQDDEEDEGNFSQKFAAGQAEALDMADDVIADSIYDWSSEQANCTNGGWQGWACPYGCGCHLLPFDPVEEESS